MVDNIGFGVLDWLDIGYMFVEYVVYLEGFVIVLELMDIVFVIYDWGLVLGFDYVYWY